MLYLWLKALHVIAVIAWMAGILYLYRLFVYHAMETEVVVMARLQVMERRLEQAIMTPAAVVASLAAFGMLYLTPALLRMPWLHAKLGLVVLLVAMHVYAVYARKRLVAEPHFKDHKFFRVANELPTLLMIGIVVLVVVKPL